MDLITSSAHRVGVSWWEQQADGNFLQRIIDASWSQAHASVFGDLDGDGDPDLVTGKNFRAQGDDDPMSHGELRLMWYEMQPGAGQAWPLIKHVISAGEDIGAGADLGLADFDGDGDLDIAVTGKNGGPWLFENLGTTPVTLAPESGRTVPRKRPALVRRGNRLRVSGGEGAGAYRDISGRLPEGKAP
jgi:hypothetical protein